MLRSKKNHKTHHRKYKKTLKMNGGASFFDPLTQYLSNTSKVNEQVEKMSEDKNILMDSMTQLTKTYNNVLSNVTELESRINGLTDLKNQCIGLYPTIASSTSTSNNNGIFSFLNPSTKEETKEEETKEEETKEEEQKEEETKEEEKPKEEETKNFLENLIEEKPKEEEETKEVRESDFPIDTNDLLSKERQRSLENEFDDLNSQGDRILKGENEILDTEEEPTESPPFNSSEYEEPTQLQNMSDLQSNKERETKKMGGKRKTKKHTRRIKKLSKKYY
jgi:hypothetical protein